MSGLQRPWPWPVQGVPLNQGNLASSLANIIATYELGPEDKSLVVMPLFHVHGLMAGLPSSPSSTYAVTTSTTVSVCHTAAFLPSLVPCFFGVYAFSKYIVQEGTAACSGKC